jgi:type IV pilus assembly protein PilX
MKPAIATSRLDQRGMVLISSLLLLLVVTILAVSMFRSFGVQEKIAGNIREKQRAVHAAISAQEWAEFWLSSGNNALSNMVSCGGSAVVAASWTSTQICANDLMTSVTASVTTVPWKIGGQEVGFTYNPGPMQVSTTGGLTSYGQATFYDLPRFYISNMGASALGANREVFRIDSWSYGGSSSTVTVIESTYEILVTSHNPTL